MKKKNKKEEEVVVAGIHKRSTQIDLSNEQI